MRASLALVATYDFSMKYVFQREDIDQLFQAASDGNLTVISECINWKNIPVDITNEVCMQYS